MTSKKIKIEIKHYLTGSVLFEYSATKNTTKKTLTEAVAKGADLEGADLEGADLEGADLEGAYLKGADLEGAYLKGADLKGADLEGAKGLKWYWHIHHETLVENLTEPLQNRIDCIKSSKPKDEIKLRLKLLKPVKGILPKTIGEQEFLHRKQCLKCPWNGRTIFPKKI